MPIIQVVGSIKDTLYIHNSDKVLCCPLNYISEVYGALKLKKKHVLIENIGLHSIMQCVQ